MSHIIASMMVSDESFHTRQGFSRTHCSSTCTHSFLLPHLAKEEGIFGLFGVGSLLVVFG
eukprot:c40460_g1_i1 orf=131-310(+)